jgi:hypothetical protein
MVAKSTDRGIVFVDFTPRDDEGGRYVEIFREVLIDKWEIF